MSDYTPQARAATSILSAKGSQVRIRQDLSTTDPLTGKVTEGYREGVFQAVVFPATGGKIQAFDLRFADELVEGTLQWAIVSGGDFVPKAGDEFVDASGRCWSVTGNTPLRPDGATVIINQMGLKQP